MVFICGLINIVITVTKLRKYIIKAIPRSLQNAIGGGIGVFVAYVGLLNVGIISFDSGVPAPRQAQSTFALAVLYWLSAHHYIAGLQS